MAATQTNRAPLFPSNRYLLVVETSYSMQRRSDGLAQTIENLLSSLASQARRGDTLGLWTFNEELITGRFPLQQWSPDEQKAITQRIVSFLKEQKLEKRGQLDRVVPAVERLVKNSGFITVILVCVGDEEIHGTLFDQRINDFFRTWRVKQQESGKPFVIALRGQSGKLVECAMNPAPWPAELPALPKELYVPLPAPVVSTPKTSSVPPLIISGKKKDASTARNTAPAEPKASNSEPVQTSNAAAVVAPVGQLSNQPIPLAESSNKASGETNSSGSLITIAPNEPVSARSGPAPLNQVSAATPLAGHVALNAQGEISSTPDSTFASAPVAITKAQESDKTDQIPSKNTGQVAANSMEMATAASSKQSRSSMVLWAAGAGALVLCGAAIWVWRRRARPVREMSLITESIDRRKG